MSAALTLVSHALCPYVQRAAIVLAEKHVPFERRDVDLADKPGWFLAISPLGKTPVLLVGELPIFESAAICEYLDETEAPRLHPDEPLARARHRAWMEFGSNLLGSIAAAYNARTDGALAEQERTLRARFEQVEAQLGAGPFFAGAAFSIVDAVFAPIFRYVPVLERLGMDVLRGLPKVGAWKQALAQRPSVRGAVAPDYDDRLLRFIAARQSALSARALALA